MLAPARQRLQALMQETLNDEKLHGAWTYLAVRPMTPPLSWKPGQHVVADCSKGCQFLARWASAPDPMQNGWDKYGNSQTIWIKLHHLQNATDLEVGDIVTFGLDGNEHAAMVMQAGADPLLWSMGHQGAPNTYRLSYDRRPRQFCRLPIADPPLTPQEKLRLETGFYSWVAWKLGEGPWVHYGEANKTVRPNVPKLIPANWWKRYVAFLANRRRPL